MQPRSEVIVASLIFTLVLLGNAVIFSIVPYLSKPEYGFELHAFQIFFCYCFIAMLCMVPWALKQGVAGLKRPKMKLYSARAILEFSAFSASFYSLQYLGVGFDLSTHTALNFITPLLATVAAIFILKEHSYAHTWGALLLGFVGVLVITRPGMVETSPGVVYVLLAATMFSLCGIVIKLLTSTESPQHVAFFMLSMTALIAAPFGIYHWKTPIAEGFLWLGVIGVIGYAQQVLIAKAIAKVPYMTLIPLNFLQLVFASILSYIVYDMLIDSWTLAGAVIILAATLGNAYMNTKRSVRKDMPEAPAESS